MFVVFLTIREVLRRTSLSRSTVYRMISAGRFPSSRQLSEGRVGWTEDSIDRWCSERLQSKSDVAAA